MARGLAQLLALIATFCVASCDRPPSLANISSVDELKTQFNQDAGKPRVILLLSPT